MRVKLVAGAEIDVLSPEEHKAQTDRTLALLKKLDKGDPTPLDRGGQLVVDAAGNLGGGLGGPGQELYKPPVGMYASIHRWALATTSHTPIAPLNQGWIMFYRGSPSSDALIAFAPAGGSTAVAPYVISEGDGAKILRNGQPIIALGAGLPANQQIGWTLQIRIWPESRPLAAPVVEA